MQGGTYCPRVIDAEVKSALSILGGVLIEGPRASGKTATGLEHSNSSVQLDTDAQALKLAGVDPFLILNGPSPRMIDEWQLEPRLWNAVRREIDDRQAVGQFILAGSSVPADDVTRHSGAGRILRIRMRPMSLYESGHSDGSVSLAALLAGETVASSSGELTVADTVDRLVIGGWPRLVSRSPDDASRALRSYLDDVARADFPRAESIRRSPERVRAVLRSLARNSAAEVSDAKLALDVGGAEPMKAATFAEYVSTLERLLLVENQPSWAPHLRSRDAIRKAPKRHFVDPSLAVASLRGSSSTLLADPNTLGLLFESLVVRDLRVYAQSLDGSVAHYRDSAGVEVDAIVTLGDGRWAAFEVKLGEARIDEAAASLTKFRDKVDTSKSGVPELLGVITTTRYAYRRPDGVHVIPLSTLGP
ncbi:ATP-binding protein [Subtercola endophyticus]|uniref:ATP-binding protein n=1 Tax=Subtercola endophyticus TaxID=2895559 RepID=UPI001E285510|nr:DUF4143 domain-containing protein [Subtercola endophyticus]UFS58078.1 DUF4143 domain-containing protein [Subtercola endophyticus]